MKSDGNNSQPYPDARPVVDAILRQAVDRRASDVHVEPMAEGYEVRLRIDGLLGNIARHDANTGRAMATNRHRGRPRVDRRSTKSLDIIPLLFAVNKSPILQAEAVRCRCPPVIPMR
jgi:hypothetical protein